MLREKVYDAQVYIGNLFDFVEMPQLYADDDGEIYVEDDNKKKLVSLRRQNAKIWLLCFQTQRKDDDHGDRAIYDPGMNDENPLNRQI